MVQEIMTFIVADPKHGGFTEEFYGYRNFIAKSNAVVIHDVNTFFIFYNMAKDDFRFRIVIHAGIGDSDKDSIGHTGLSYLGEIMSDERFKYLDIPFMSRKRSLFLDATTRNENLYRIIDDYKCYNAWVFNTPKRIDEVLSDIPIYSKAEIENSKPGLKKGLDFAILTALYEDEFQIYKEHCETIPDRITSNCYDSKFIRKVDRVKDDYEKNFALIHQEQMGLVDAAIYSTQIVDKIDPKFLLMGGVCGGLKGSVELYDIIIPTVVYDYATGKMKGEDKDATEPSIDLDKKLKITYEGDKKLVSGKLEPKNYKADSEKLLTSFLEKKKPEIIQNMKELMPETEKKNFPANFDIHINEFACGPWVVKTDGFLDDYLLEVFSNQIKGLEMESYSINRVGNIAQKYGRFSLVVKSVMDFTDPKKKDGPDGRIKKFAALMSFICIRAMMPILLEFNDPKITE